MSIRTAVPILIASLALAGFAPAASAELPLTPPAVPTVATAPEGDTNQQLIPTMPVAIAPTTTESTTTAEATTTTTTESTTAPTTTETTTVPAPQLQATTTTETTTAAPPTTVAAAAPPETTTTTTVPETTTSTPTETTTPPMTTVPPSGDIALTTSPLTTSSAEVGARTLTLTFSVTVTDSRTNSAGWTASAWVSNLVTADGNVVVPASFSYASGATSCSTASPRVLSSSPAVVQSSNSACSASWTVTVVVTLTDSATIADVYNATIEHSVTGLTAAPATQPSAA